MKPGIRRPRSRPSNQLPNAAHFVEEMRLVRRLATLTAAALAHVVTSIAPLMDEKSRALLDQYDAAAHQLLSLLEPEAVARASRERIKEQLASEGKP